MPKDVRDSGALFEIYLKNFFVFYLLIFIGINIIYIYIYIFTDINRPLLDPKMLHNFLS